MKIEEHFSAIVTSPDALTEFSAKRTGEILETLHSSITNPQVTFMPLSEHKYILSSHGLDYTLLALLPNGTEFFNEALKNVSHSIDEDISRNGYACIWRSVGIKDERLKRRVVSEFIEALDKWLPDLFSKQSQGKYIHGDLIFEIMTRNRHATVERSSPLCEFIDKNLLFDNLRDRVNVGYRYAAEIGEEYRPLAVFLWLAPLCHRAYIDGHQASDIVKGAGEIIDGLAQAIGIRDRKFHEIYKRRCLAHIAMGFVGLMKEIGFNREDIRYLSADDHENVMFRDMEHLRTPPILELSIADQVSMAYHDGCSLREVGITIDIDQLMDIEMNKAIYGGALLAATADYDPSVMIQAIHHPLWNEIRHLMLSTDHDKKMPLEVQAAVLKRESQGPAFSTVPAINGPWDRAEKQSLIGLLYESDALTMQVIKRIKPDSDIIRKYRDRMPKEAMRYAISDDMGL